jgi:hypothetical protein
MSGDTPPPTGLMPRFTLFIEAMKRGLSEGIDQRHVHGGTPRETLWAMGTFGLVLFHYLSATLRGVAALHARFVAGTLAPSPRAPRPREPRPAAEQVRAERRTPSIPPGQVFLQYYMGHFVLQLRAMLEDPEMRALLAATPRAGRLLRPLWHKLTADPLPEVLRLPRGPRQSRRVARPTSARPRKPSIPRAALPAPPPEAPRLWEPTPCLPPWPD